MNNTNIKIINSFNFNYKLNYYQQWKYFNQKIILILQILFNSINNYNQNHLALLFFKPIC